MLVERGRSLAAYPVPVDLAAWLLSIGFTSPSRYAREWRLAWRRAAFSVDLILALLRGAPTDEVASDVVLRDSLRLVRDEVRRARGLRAGIANRGIQIVARVVVWRVRRALSVHGSHLVESSS